MRPDRPHQSRALREYAALVSAGERRVLIQSPTGSGKCLGLGTPVLLHDGSVVAVQEVRVGDLLMGPDSKPRKVLSTARGSGPLYRIVPVKGEPWVCNDIHVLTLVNSSTGVVSDIGLQEYLASNATFRHLSKLFTPEDGVDFPVINAPPVDPYFMGLWYGDGTKALQCVEVSKPDVEVLAACQDVARTWGLRVETRDEERCARRRLVGREHNEKGHCVNRLLTAMREVYGDGFRLPHWYLVGSRDTRSAFLAGLLDSDGYLHNGCFEIVQKRKAWSEGIRFLARSLGLRAIMAEKVVNGDSYWRVSISGKLDALPMRIARKKAPARLQKKVATRTGFRVEPIGRGDYFGFELDSDGRFLLGDFTVTHNTHLGLRCAEMMTSRRGRVLWCAHRDELVDQPTKRILADGWPLDNLCVVSAGRSSGNRDAQLTIASVQTLLAMPEHALAALLSTIDLFVLDEARHYAAAQWSRVARCAKSSAYMLGLDATPVRADGKPLGDLFSRILIGATVAELVEAGHLVPSVVMAPAMYQDELAEDPVDAYCRVTPGQSAIVFCGNVTHARNVAAGLRARYYQAEAVDSKTSDDKRDSAIERFISGDLQVLCNVRLFTEGTDLPRAQVIIHAAHCGSLSDWIQKGGRGLRPSPETGKTRCTVLDLHGSVHEHGLLDDPHEWCLDGSGVRAGDPLPQIGQCPRCYAWGRSAARCASCGFVLPMFAPPPPRVRAADLVEIRKSDPADVRRERLCAWALREMRAGRSAWRACHIFSGTYGEMPPPEWMKAAQVAAENTMAREARAQVEAAEPLWERMR